MGTVYSDLLEILERERDCCAALLEHSRQKKDSLVKNDVAAIEAGLAVETDLTGLMDRAEQERLAETRRIAEKLGCPLEELTISRMVELSEEPDSSRFERIKGELGSILKEQLRLNDVNKSLLESQLTYIEFIINATTTPSSLTNSYTANGSAPESDERLKFFDHQI